MESIEDAEDTTGDLEPFKKGSVDEYSANKAAFTKHPLRHYSQTETEFDPRVVSGMLAKLHIPNSAIGVTVFGGFTGEFTKCLRDIGFRVIFTDPLEEWVEKARSNGFEAHRYTAAQIPGTIASKTDLFATFECYQPFVEPSWSHSILRFLSSGHGIILAESKRTRDELKREKGVTGQMKLSMLAYGKVYSVNREFRESRGLRIYHFSAEEGVRDTIRLDCRVLKTIHDSFPEKSTLGREEETAIAESLRLRVDEVESSVGRALELYYESIPPSMKAYFPSGMIKIFSRRYNVSF